ncbi:hypothetical protein EHH44_03155 [Mycolicibacter terrae]|uniref:Uncharacterized protein n=1 Tax=Mycolicibacter terrae TaxID=1788 RepID=A0ACD2ES33_9MYCO|nr:hypothetical protein [Mycolicibacter terrae]RRR47862.1 hypothetical protein EHH44_03155 [Mycolicibacter terrae]
MSAPTTLTSKDIAEALDIDPKALRVFLRSGNAEGMFTREGKSYVFAKTDVAKLKKGYAAFVASRGTKARALAVVADETAEAIQAS